MEQARLCIAYTALVVGTICFLVYIVDAAITLAMKPKALRASGEAANIVARAKPDPNARAAVTDLTGLAEALAKLADALAKAGPTLTSLIGAVLFYAIAAIASGSVQSAPEKPAPSTETSTSAGTTGSTVQAGDKGEMPTVKAKLPPPSR